MNAIDRAFIRAYETDDDAPATAPSTARRQNSPPPVERPAIAAPHFRAAPDAAPSDRRPLSTFAATPPAVEARFRPSLEVDAFRWPTIADELFQRHTAHWRAVVKTLLAADEAGRSLIGVGGTTRGVGCTTIVGCIARLLVEAGKTVAVVDGDFATAGLARSLGIGADIGWEDVLAGRVPLAESVVHSLGDRVALLPLVQGGVPAAEKLDGIHASVTAGVLRYHYDFVLFDLGAVADEVQGPIARRVARRCRLDGVLLAAAAEHAAEFSPARWGHVAPELANICLGLIANHRAGA